MYIESSSPNTKGNTAQLWSPSYPAQGGHCVEFFYHMQGDSMGTLNVYALPTGGNLSAYSPIWYRSGNQGLNWNTARLDASSLADFQVRCFFFFIKILGVNFQDTEYGYPSYMYITNLSDKQASKEKEKEMFFRSKGGGGGVYP